MMTIRTTQSGGIAAALACAALLGAASTGRGDEPAAGAPQTQRIVLHVDGMT